MNKSEENKQNWKELRIAEYAQLAREEAGIAHAMDSDPRLNELAYNLKNLEAETEKQKAPFIEKIAQLQHEQAGIKLELAEKWDVEEKTFKSDIGEIVLRTTRSLVIQDKDKLIGFLQTIKKLNECIRNFDISKIRKFKEVGLIENEIATWSEKHNISIRLIGGQDK